MALAAIAAGADGLMIEVHQNPKKHCQTDINRSHQNYLKSCWIKLVNWPQSLTRIGVEMIEQTKYLLPGKNGKFGEYGGKFVPETLIPALYELEDIYNQLKTTWNSWRS